MLDGGGGGEVMFIRLMEEAVVLSGRLGWSFAGEWYIIRLVWSVAGERSVERLGGSFLNILKSKNI